MPPKRNRSAVLREWIAKIDGNSVYTTDGKKKLAFNNNKFTLFLAQNIENITENNKLSEKSKKLICLWKILEILLIIVNNTDLTIKKALKIDELEFNEKKNYLEQLIEQDLKGQPILLTINDMVLNNKEFEKKLRSFFAYKTKQK
uniref:Uncharacterized protein n=1 Tax=Meloidogyne enterolobii TaxID=390850 RepID=A0A6V7X357_MELEN|nr:unnamed protein product [Meloidogyne enterolobii]